ncbi:hypothetical protein DNTS_005821, partial [Danionella cerebrum]
GNLDADTADYKREQAESEKVRSALQKQHDISSSTTAQLETEVERLRQIFNEKSQTIEHLKAKLKEKHSACRNLSDDLVEKTKHHHQRLHSEKESLDQMSVRSEEVLHQIKRLELKTKRSLSKAVVFKHGTATKVMGNIERDVTSCEKRKSQHAQIHSDLLTQRQSVMRLSEASLQKPLKDNVKLAQEYQDLQKALMMAKQEVVCAVNKRNQAEACILDHKQLSLLQERMHKALVKYFKQRSVYSQAELARFQTLSNQNNQKMKALQEELSSAIQRLSAFLLSLTDDSTSVSLIPQQAEPHGKSRKMIS